MKPVNYSNCNTQPEIIKHRGYPVEIHRVTTGDHYILELHRIPYGRRGRSKAKTVGRGRPVFLQHGVFASSAHWLIAPSNSSLGNYSLVEFSITEQQQQQQKKNNIKKSKEIDQIKETCDVIVMDLQQRFAWRIWAMTCGWATREATFIHATTSIWIRTRINSGNTRKFLPLFRGTSSILA